MKKIYLFLLMLIVGIGSSWAQYSDVTTVYTDDTHASDGNWDLGFILTSGTKPTISDGVIKNQNHWKRYYSNYTLPTAIAGNQHNTIKLTFGMGQTSADCVNVVSIISGTTLLAVGTTAYVQSGTTNFVAGTATVTGASSVTTALLDPNNSTGWDNEGHVKITSTQTLGQEVTTTTDNYEYTTFTVTVAYNSTSSSYQATVTEGGVSQTFDLGSSFSLDKILVTQDGWNYERVKDLSVEVIQPYVVKVSGLTSGGGVVYNSTTYTNGQAITGATSSSTLTAASVTGYTSRLWKKNETVNVVYNADFDIQSTYSAASAKYYFLMTDRDDAYLNASNLTSDGYIIPTATKHGTTDAVWSFVGSSTSDLAIRNYGTGDSYITAASAESDAGVGLGNDASATYARFNVSPALTTGWWLINVKNNATSYFNKMTNNLAIWNNDNALWGWGGTETSPKDDSDEGSKISITEADMYLVQITGLASADASKGYVTIGGEQFANGAYYCFVKGATVSADDITAAKVDYYNAGTPVVDATNKKITLAYTATSNIYTVAAGAEATLSEISGYADYDYINVNGKLTIDVEDFDLTKIICASTGELEYAKDFSLSTLPTHKVTISSGATLTIETTFADNHEGDATDISNVYGEGTLKVALTGDLSDSGNGDGKYTKLTASNFEGTLEITSGLLQMGSTLNDDATIKLNGGGIVLPADVTYFTNAINVAGTGYIRAYGNVGANDKTLSNTITGTGTIKKTDGGTLKLTGTLTGFTGALDIRKGYVEVASTAKLSDVTIADDMYFCVSNSSTVTIGTAQTAIADVAKHATTTAQYYKVESGSTIKDNRYHQLTGGSLNVLGTGTMEVYGFCLSSTGKSVSTVNVAANTTLHIIGKESSNTGNSGAFMLSNWPAENVVNIDGTIISKALLSTRDGSPTININNGGTLTMTIGLGIANNGYSSTINTKSGGTLKIGGNHTTNYTTLTVNMEDGSTLTSNANGTTMGQTLTVGDDASVTFSAADGLTLGVQSAITNNGTITTSGTVTLTGALSGAGTINLATFPTSSSKPSSISNWTGTIVCPAVTVTQGNLTDIFNAWGNTSSTMKLNNTIGYFDTGRTVDPTLNILENATVSIIDGSSDKTPLLTKVTGAGILEQTWSKGSNHTLKIATLSDFTGTLKGTNKPILVQNLVYPENTTWKVGNKLLSTSGIVTLTKVTVGETDKTLSVQKQSDGCYYAYITKAKYYRFESVAHDDIYIQGTLDPTALAWSTNDDGLSVFYLSEDGTLQNYGNGKYVKAFATTSDDADDAAVFTIKAGSVTDNSYNIGTTYNSALHYYKTGSSDPNYYIAWTDDLTSTEAEWYITEVDEEDLPIYPVHTGKFYRIESSDNAGYYIQGAEGSQGISLSTTADAASIYYIDANNRLMNYSTGKYISHDDNYYTSLVVGSTNADVYTIAKGTADNTVTFSPITNYYLYDNESASVAVINATDWILHEVTSLPLTTDANGYATFSAPVALTIPSTATAQNGTSVACRAYIATSAGDNTITLTKVSGSIPAETGIIIRTYDDTGKAGLKTDLSFPIISSSTTDVSANKLAAKYDASPVVKKDNYFFGSVSGTYCFASLSYSSEDETYALGAHKCYLANTKGARKLTINWDDEDTPTAIEGIEENTTPTSADGKYIVNGKVVIVKNGVKYNTTGQRVD